VDHASLFAGLKRPFDKKSVAEALRELLESFRLPGEAQQIERITSTFAECFFATKPRESYFCRLMLIYSLGSCVPAEIKTQDAVFILAFAVIMLNTDQHSPNIRVSLSGAITLSIAYYQT
jgi:brefeldin A-resistance guanine nucleotide exchange factor 1